MRHRIKTILIYDRMLMSRLGLAVGSLLWAIQLLLPASLFPTPEQIAAGVGRQTYSLMATVAPEEVWAILFLLHGSATLYALCRHVRSGALVWVDGILGCVLWSGATLFCFAAHWPKNLPWLEAWMAYPPPAAMSADLVLAFFAWWHMIRLLADETQDKDK